MNSLRFLTLGILCSPCLPGLSAQAPLWDALGDANYDFLGYDLDIIGDLNGDGVDDVVAGGPGDDNNGQDCGLIRVFDGATGTLLFTYDGDNTNDDFGHSVAGVGDVDGDGIPDFGGAAWLDDNNGPGSGMVRIFSGSTGAQLLQIDGAASKDFFGGDMAGIGDVNGDGNSDFIVGAVQKDPSVTGPSNLPGYALVLSGATGAPIWSLSGTVANNQYGDCVAGGGDADGDGVPDFAVGVYGDDTSAQNAGAVHVYSGATGILLWSAFGDSSRDHLGNAIDFVDDLDGDGKSDLLVGAFEDDNVATNSGSVRVFSGATGAVLATVDGQNANDEFGWSVSGWQDFTGDGIPEFLVGCPRFDGALGLDTGMVAVVDGATFTVIQQAEGSLQGDIHGFSTTGAGDLNGDLIPDFLGGSFQYGGSGGIAPGRGYIRAYDPTGMPPPPPPQWPSLPTAFQTVGPLGYDENFDTLAGTVPAWMATNMLDFYTRTLDVDAWCNLGQLGYCQAPYSGSFNLELGGNPSMTSNHDVANGLILGLDGTGSTSLVMDLWVINYGEENHSDDGIFLSSDGVNWETVILNWGSLAPTNSTWTQASGLDLTTTSVDTTSTFYLRISQADNYAFANNDGIGIDDISIHEATPSGPFLTIAPNPPVAGQVATLMVSNNNPGETVIIGYSLVGAGPTNTPFGSVDMTPPISQFPALTAGVSGVASFAANVPPVMSGRRAWVQGLNLTQRVLTNSLALVFL